MMNINHPLLSVIIPVYNTEKFLRKCLDSIVEQTYRNLEVIIVNDGSLENENAIIKEYIELDDRIRVIQHQENRGLFQARITGMEAAKGEYFTFVDSDDSISIDYYRLLIKKAVETDSDMVIADFANEYEDGRQEYYNLDPIRLQDLKLKGEQVLEAFMQQQGLFFGWHTVWNKIYSIDLWEQGKKYLKDFAEEAGHLVMTEDIAFSCVFWSFARKVTNVHNVYYFYARHEKQSTVVRNLEKFKKNVTDGYKVFEFFRTIFVELGNWENFKKEYIKWRELYIKYWCENARNYEILEFEQATLFIKSFFNIDELLKITTEDNYFYIKSTKIRGLKNMPNIRRLLCNPEKVSKASESKDSFIYGLAFLLKPRKILAVSDNKSEWDNFFEFILTENDDFIYIPPKDTAVLPLICRDIEFCVFDCSNQNPLALMYFLNIFPFLRKSAVCVIKNLKGSSKFLFDCVTADKILSDDFKTGAFQITSDTHKYIENVFLGFSEKWEVIPNMKNLFLFEDNIERYYSKNCSEILKKSISAQEESDKNIYFDFNNNGGRCNNDDFELTEYLKIYIEENPFPSLQEIGEAMLSVIGGNNTTDWDFVRGAVSGEYMQLALDTLIVAINMDNREKWEEFARLIHGIFWSASVNSIYSKEVGMRVTEAAHIEMYAAYSMMQAWCNILFKDYKARLIFIYKSMRRDEWRWLIKPLYMVIAARVMLERNHIITAYLLAKKACSQYSNYLHINDIFTNMARQIQEKNLNEEYEALEAYAVDMKEYFCPMPFELLMIAEYDFKIDMGSYYLCQCASWLPVRFNSDNPWNGEHFQKFRKSILDGSYRFCNKAGCPYIINRDNWWLKKKQDITDPKLRDIIDNNRITLDYSPKEIVLGYDFHCNLKCPSCRDNFRHLSENESEQLDCYMEKTLLPLLKTAKILKLSGQGEAFASMHSLKLLRVLTSDEYPDLEIYVQTNGTSITRNKWKSIGEARKNIKQIVVSIDGANKETFEKLRYPARWEKLLESMEFLSEVRKNGELKSLHVNFVLQAENYNQLWDMLELCEIWGVDIFMAQRINNLGSFTLEEYEKADIVNREHPEHLSYIESLENFKRKVSERENGFNSIPKVTLVDF